MKLWIDDVRPAPYGYVPINSVDEAREFIVWCECTKQPINLIDIDHDSGVYFFEGGDYIKLLEWLEETGRNYPIHIHSTDMASKMNMRRIIQRND